MRRLLILTGAGGVLLVVFAVMKMLELRFGWPDSPRRNLSAGAVAGGGFLKLADRLGWLDEEGGKLSLIERGHNKSK